MALGFDRRVHITRATLDYLGDKFEVEPGGGAGRESYLADHKVETFLIVPPKVSACAGKQQRDHVYVITFAHMTSIN